MRANYQREDRNNDILFDLKESLSSVLMIKYQYGEKLNHRTT